MTSERRRVGPLAGFVLVGGLGFIFVGSAIARRHHAALVPLD